VTTPRDIHPDRAHPVLPAAEAIRELQGIARAQQPIAEGLVLLREFPELVLARAIEDLRVGVTRNHPRAAEPMLHRSERDGSLEAEKGRQLRREHAMFESSFFELDHYRERAKVDPHGGNRQALGQYWRLVLEALERHLADELPLAGRGETVARTLASRSAPPPSE
jgi:hypothetical protein